MPIDATRSGVASSVASYFSSNYEALLQSSAAQQPVTPLAPQAWMDAINATTGVRNRDTRFFLKQDGSIQALSSSATSAAGWTQPANSVEIDTNVAYGIQNAGLSASDWLMQRIADEFRLNSTSLATGSVLSQNPEPEMNVDLSSLDTASLVRLLNMLTGRARDGQRDAAIGNARDLAANAARLGLSAANLRNALELQATYAGNSTVNSAVESLLTGQGNATRDTLVNNAMSRLVANKTSEFSGAQLAFGNSPAGRVNAGQLNRMMQLLGKSVDASLQSAADIALMDNPYVGKFGSDLEYTQTSDGLLTQSMSGATRAQQIAYVRDQLKAGLSDPAFKQNLIDAMAAQAQELGTADLDLADQQALYGQMADALISAALEDDAYLEDLATQSVDFRSEISQLIGNEVEASRERESVYKNV